MFKVNAHSAHVTAFPHRATRGRLNLKSDYRS